MKKIILFSLLSFAAMTAHSQSANDLLIYGGINFHRTDGGNGNDYNALYLRPGVGYHISDKWAAGVAVDWSNQRYKDSSDTVPVRLERSLSVGPFVRYTQKINDIFFVYGQLDLAYSTHQRFTGGNVVPGSKVTGFMAEFAPSVGINVVKGFALNFGFGGIGFQSRKGERVAISTSEITFNFGQTLRFGVSKFINMRRKATPQTVQ